MGPRISALAILLCSLLLLATAQAREPYVVFVEGQLKTYDANMSLLETREYVMQRVCYPDEKRIVESIWSWVGEDTESLLTWEQSFELGDDGLVFQREGCTDGGGELTGRMWSWDTIKYSYLDEDGLRHSWEGRYSGAKCKRAGVVLDAKGQLVSLLADESNVITDEQYVMLQAIYERIRTGHN